MLATTLAAEASVTADPALVRAVALFAPALVLVAVLAWQRPAPADIAAAIVATAWSAVTVFALNLLSLRLGWWDFAAHGAVVHGVPVDLWLGWSVLWGALPAALIRELPAPLVVAVLAWLDLILMPLAEPVVRLGPTWMLGEGIGLLTCLVPAVLLARWTRLDRYRPARVWAQAGLAAALMFGLPLYLLDAVPPWPPSWAAVGGQILALALLPGLAAAREFAVAGHGTPLPYDPPRRLVTSGPYAYVRNPMQLSAGLGYLGCAALFADPRLLLGAVVAVAYGAGLAAWHEGEQLRRAYGAGWRAYRSAVRAWLPRARPWPGRTPATLYVAGSCSMCSGLGGWVAARGPVALRLLPAEAHPGLPRRLTYESAAGVRASGVAALARAMEHLHLGWALLGWVVALPGVAGFAQLAADAFGAGPRSVAAPVGRAAPEGADRRARRRPRPRQPGPSRVVRGPRPRAPEG